MHRAQVCEQNTSGSREMTKNISIIFWLKAIHLNLDLMELPAEQQTKNGQ